MPIKQPRPTRDSEPTEEGPSPTPEAPLRLLVITENDPLYVRQFFEVFFRELPKDCINLLGVTVLPAFREPLLSTARRVFRFYGARDFLRVLPRFFAAKLKGQSIERLAHRFGFPLLETQSVNSQAYLDRVQTLRPDVIISVAAPELFKSGLLRLATLGCLNIHSGKVPEYRGMMPTFWQMLEGRPTVTVTVHEMVEKLDAGGVVETLEFPILPCDSLDRVISGTKREGARLMLRVLCGIARLGKMPPTLPLDMTRERLFKFPQPKDVERFRALGHRML